MSFVRMKDVPHNTVVRTKRKIAILLFFEGDIEFLLSTMLSLSILVVILENKIRI